MPWEEPASKEEAASFRVDLAEFVKIVVFKTKLFKGDWSGSARLLREQRDR
ncbi:hypothetical protein [Peribacillus frigoritolerans]|uniref:hypothetical protein n=1 Tax=Peribacillus frigoritolerans TaxID=450367 RepID=UPI00207A8E30|nr:hypothetical protein [Peribacillus frigoritolerans]USK77246.1 hypothetical protein LIT31_12310 [Peribacillus frigoritolerans]